LQIILKYHQKNLEKIKMDFIIRDKSPKTSPYKLKEDNQNSIVRSFQ
jgi:hypothetical protein